MGDTDRRRIVVGDVHGDLRGLREILLHARVTDHSGHWAGGSTILIQTGDVIDRGPHSRGAVSLLRRLQQEAAASAGVVVRCVGNHELMLLQGHYRYVNFSDPLALAGEFRREIAQGLLRAAYTDGERLYTHAGLRSIVRAGLVEELQQAHTSRRKSAVGLSALAAHINTTLEKAVRQGRLNSEEHGIFWVGSERGGRNRVGGIFWCDCTRIEESDRAWDVPQVFGHTPTGKPALRHAHGLKLIDVDAGMVELYGGNRVYLEITAEGGLIQHSKVGNEWASKVLKGRD